MSNEYIENRREHYIPQFILRNFSIDKFDNTYFYSKKDKKIHKKYIKNIFMEMNLYDDVSTDNTNPRQLEEDLSKYEKEIAELLKKKVFNKEKIILTFDEEEALKLFFVLLDFRSVNTRDYFNNLKETNFEFYSMFQSNKDFESFWKRNLSYLVNCRSLEEILRHNKIDVPIKGFMIRDLFTLNKPTYLVFFEKRDNIDFIIGDKYPLRLMGAYEGINIPVIFYCPLSPKFMMAIIPMDAKNSPTLAIIKDKLVAPQFINKNYVHIPKKLYKDDVLEIDYAIFNCSKTGVVFKDKKTYEYIDSNKEEIEQMINYRGVL